MIRTARSSSWSSSSCRRAAGALLAALLASGPLGCVAFPAYPGESEARIFDELPRRGGVVRVDASFELIGNGRWMASRPAQRQKYVAPVASAYRLSGVFDRVAEPREQPDVVAQVDVRGLMRANRPLLALSMLSLFIVPGWARSGVEVDTVLRDAQTGGELGRARTCHAFREVAHLSMLPLVPTHAIGPVEVDTIFGLARRGLALALATEADRARSPELAAAAAAACPASARLPRWHAVRDDRSTWQLEQLRLEEGPCLTRPSVKTYLEEVAQSMNAAWQPPPGAMRPVPVDVSFSLQPDGSLRSLAVPMEADPAFAESAVSAARRAAPFPPLTGPLECLADEELLAPFGKRPALRY